MARPRIIYTVCDSEMEARKSVPKACKKPLRLNVVQNPKDSQPAFVMAPSSAEAIASYAEQRLGIFLGTQPRPPKKERKPRAPKLAEIVEKLKESTNEEIQKVVEIIKQTQDAIKEADDAPVAAPTNAPLSGAGDPPPPPV